MMLRLEIALQEFLRKIPRNDNFTLCRILNEVFKNKEEKCMRKKCLDSLLVS